MVESQQQLLEKNTESKILHMMKQKPSNLFRDMQDNEQQC